jgi:hypothetical protein
VVEYQQALQTVSDPLLGWTTIDGLQYYVRQFRAWGARRDPLRIPPVAAKAPTAATSRAGDRLSRRPSNRLAYQDVSGVTALGDTTRAAALPSVDPQWAAVYSR